MTKRRNALLTKMSGNPTGDWTIEDVSSLVTSTAGMDLRKPKGSSHYVVVSDVLRDRLCVPFKRPIKTKYIRLLVRYVESHIAGTDEMEGEDE